MLVQQKIFQVSVMINASISVTSLVFTLRDLAGNQLSVQLFKPNSSTKRHLLLIAICSYGLNTQAFPCRNKLGQKAWI